MVARVTEWLHTHVLMLWTVALYLVILVLALHWGPVPTHPVHHSSGGV
jgi:hypothetical protein